MKINLKKFIRDVPDFPKKGILFRDITTLLSEPKAFKYVIDTFSLKFKNKKIDAVVAIEARGFILGAAVAYKLGAAFVPVRKKGKLPARTNSVTYDLEYGTDTLEMHHDALGAGNRVLIVDDLLATGGTVKAVTDLLKQLQAKIIGIAFLIELTDLKGKERLAEFPVYSLIKY